MKIAIFTLFIIIFILYIMRHQIFIHTSTMAAIMAFGIIIYGVLPHFFGDAFSDTVIAKILVTIVSALWISFWVSIASSILKGKWTSLHYTNPVNRFGIGTWIAATSICSILILKSYPSFRPLVVGVSLANGLLWIFYILISIKAVMTIMKTNKLKEIHGILLLTTVSTQSLVMLVHTIFPGVPEMLTFSLFMVGIIFYLVNTFLLLKRYFTKAWVIETDWNNTNCILHGALSITGVASIVSGIANTEMQYLLWGITAVIFLVVETIEVYRLVRLVNQFSWKKAIGTYNVSQWSRIFTFSMFYTFTVSIPALNGLFTQIQGAVKQIGFVVILALVMYEIFLALKHLFETKAQKDMLNKAA